MLVFWQTSILDRGVCREEEAVFGRVDRRRAQASGAGHGGGGHYPAGGYFGTDVLPLEEVARRLVHSVVPVRLCTSFQAAACRTVNSNCHSRSARSQSPTIA